MTAVPSTGPGNEQTAAVRDGRDLDTRQHGTEPPFHYWEGDHTALVHVLWHAKHEGLSLDDADEIASLVMRSRWLAANRAEGARQELGAAAQAALDEGGRRRAYSIGDWLLNRADALRAKEQHR